MDSGDLSWANRVVETADRDDPRLVSLCAAQFAEDLAYLGAHAKLLPIYPRHLVRMIIRRVETRESDIRDRTCQVIGELLAERQNSRLAPFVRECAFLAFLSVYEEEQNFVLDLWEVDSYMTR